MGVIPEALARRILAQAIAEDRCADFFECLMDGGSATINVSTGKLALASGAALADLIARSHTE